MDDVWTGLPCTLLGRQPYLMWRLTLSSYYRDTRCRDGIYFYFYLQDNSRYEFIQYLALWSCTSRLESVIDGWSWLFTSFIVRKTNLFPTNVAIGGLFKFPFKFLLMNHTSHLCLRCTTDLQEHMSDFCWCNIFCALFKVSKVRSLCNVRWITQQAG